MNPRPRLALVFFALLISNAFCLDEIAAYRASDIENSSNGMVWRDSRGKNNLQMTDPSGFSIGDKPSIGDDSKSAVFSGQQTMPFRSTAAVDVPTGALQVSLAFNASANATTDEQTLLRHGNWEIRYSSAKQRLLFIVWHDTKEYTLVAVPAEAGVWHQVKASFEAGQMKLEVDGVAKSTEAKGPLGTQYATSAIFVGASTGSTASGVEFRPLCGALANIRISAQ